MDERDVIPLLRRKIAHEVRNYLHVKRKVCACVAEEMSGAVFS